MDDLAKGRMRGLAVINAKRVKRTPAAPKEMGKAGRPVKRRMVHEALHAALMGFAEISAA